MPTEVWTKRLAYWAIFPLLAGLATSNSLFTIFSSAFMILSILVFLQEKRWSFFADRWFLCLALFFLLNLASVFQSEYVFHSLRGVFRTFRYLVLCLSVIYVLDTESKWNAVFRWAGIVAFVIGLDAVIQGVTGHEILRHRNRTRYMGEVYRLTGPFPHANDFSAYLSMTLFLFVGAVKNLFHGAALLLLAGCLVSTYARGAWLAVAFSVMLWAVFLRKKKVVAGLLLAMAVAFFVAPVSIKTRLQSFAQLNDGTFSERRLLWQEALDMMRDRPWLGFGPNTYSKMEPLYKSKQHSTDYQYAHNGYLQIGAEIGVPGLLSLLMVLAYFLAACYGTLRRAPPGPLKSAAMGILFGVLAFLIHGATDTDFQSLLLMNLLWFMMGLVWAAKRLSASA